MTLFYCQRSWVKKFICPSKIRTSIEMSIKITLGDPEVPPKIYRWSLTYDGSTWFFDFVMQKWYTVSKSCTADFEFWSFPRLAICDTILSHDAKQWQQPQLLVSATIVRINSWCTDSHSVPMQPVWFSLSVQ